MTETWIRVSNVSFFAHWLFCNSLNKTHINSMLGWRKTVPAHACSASTEFLISWPSWVQHHVVWFIAKSTVYTSIKLPEWDWGFHVSPLPALLAHESHWKCMCGNRVVEYNTHITSLLTQAYPMILVKPLWKHFVCKKKKVLFPYNNRKMEMSTLFFK